MAGAGLVELRTKTYKSRDAWWTVLLVDPLASRLTYIVARHTLITPNQLTVLAFVIGMGAAGCFAKGDHGWLIGGAVLYHLSFVVDCMDGKLARFQDRGSVFGGWLDYVLDRIRVLVCAQTLMAGQYARTDNTVFLWVGVAVVFLDMFRYLNSLQVFKIRAEMRKKLEEAYENACARPVFMEDVLRAVSKREPTLDSAKSNQSVIDLQQEFRSRFSWYIRFRNFLLRRRIRTHLVSGVEFQMAVFIIAPVTGVVLPITAVAGALLLLFELAIIYKLYLSTRDFTKALARLTSSAEHEEAAGHSSAQAAEPRPAALGGAE